MKKIYFYDQDTHEYLGQDNAFLDPLETKRQRKEIYLLPANATFELPLEEKEGYARIFQKSWQYVADNRGKKAVNTERGLFTIDYLGERQRDTLITAELKKDLDEGRKIIRNGAIIDKPIEDKKAEMRLKRDILLLSTDKMMLEDYPLTDEEREQYRQYRKYLRDIPKAEEFPELEVKTFEEWSAQQD